MFICGVFWWLDGWTHASDKLKFYSSKAPQNSEAEANAHAISLLPDMIEALRDFITHYAGPKREQLGNGYAYQWYTRANNLLKRIEG